MLSEGLTAQGPLQKPHQFSVARPGLLKRLHVTACEGGWHGFAGGRFWAAGWGGGVVEGRGGVVAGGLGEGRDGPGSGRGGVPPVGHVTNRGIRPRTTRRMAWSGQAVGR